MRKNLILVSMLAAFAFIFMGCPQQPKEEVETTPTLQSLIDNAKDGSTVDLSAKKFTVGSEIKINKAITITGGKTAYDLKDVKVTVKTDGVKIENVANVAELIADETVKSITLGGTINIATVEAASSDFKIVVASNDVKIQTAVIKTSDGTTTNPKIEAASEDVDLSKLDVPNADADTVYEKLGVKVDDTWQVVLINTSKSKYKVISHDENSLVIDILEDLNDQIHVEYKFKEIDLTEYKDISYNIKANSTGTMKVGYWTDEDLGSNSASSYSPEGVNSSFPTIKQTDKSGVLYFVTNKAGRYEISNISATVYELPSTSKEGRLSLEAVEGGIKVTARLLDSDETPSNYNNFDIKERKTGICLLLEKPSDTQREVSGIYPFVKENERYEFEFLLQTASIPWHTEVAGCKATSTGLNPDEYFDFDYAPASAKRILNDEGYLSIDKDVKKFFKQTPASLYMDGGIFAGCSEPWKADWVSAWHSKLINYDNDNWKIDVDYDKLISTKGFDLGSVLKADSSKLAKLKSKDTWFVQGDIYFTVDNCDMEFKINFIKDDDASTDIFKAVKTFVDYLPNNREKNRFTAASCIFR